MDGAGDDESRIGSLLEKHLKFLMQKLIDITNERQKELGELLEEKARHSP
jgi:hypothetical protein